MPTRVFALFLLAFALASAQVLPSRNHIRAVGEASVPAEPDQATVAVSVVVQAATAQEAAAQNATQLTTVLTALRQLVGTNGDLRTTGYSITPNYNYPRDSPAVLVGYTASNTIEATVRDVALVGRVIDTAVSSGANRIGGIRFGLRDDAALRAQALRQAGQRAHAKAEAIAGGLNVRIGGVLSASEGVVTTFYAPDARTAAPGVTTPVEPGTITVSATVTIEVEIAG